MCGCHRCGQYTNELGHATPDMCINVLKGELRAAREGREMVRESLTAERARLHEALDNLTHAAREFETAAGYTVEVGVEDEFITALEAAEAALATNQEQA